MTTPIIWSIAGTDSGGGAGLAADQRAADALGVHCCTVVAGITAQSTTEVTHIEATPPAVLQAQLDTLARDMPPKVIKTGLLGSADNVRVLVAFIDGMLVGIALTLYDLPLGLLVEPFDLSMALGLPPGDNDGKALFDAAIARINAAARSRGIATAVLSTAALAPLRAQQGFQMISVITDSNALTAAGIGSLKQAKAAISKENADA